MPQKYAFYSDWPNIHMIIWFYPYLLINKRLSLFWPLAAVLLTISIRNWQLFNREEPHP